MGHPGLGEGDGFLFEGDGEAAVDFGGDVVAEGQEIGAGGGAGAVDEGEGVAGADADGGLGREGEAFGEAGARDEPGGGELDLAWAGGPVGDLRCGDGEGDGDLWEDFGGDDGVLEEAAGGTGVWRGVGGVDQHALAVADEADGFVNFERGRVCAGAEVVAEVGVAEVGFCVGG